MPLCLVLACISICASTPASAQDKGDETLLDEPLDETILPGEIDEEDEDRADIDDRAADRDEEEEMEEPLEIEKPEDIEGEVSRQIKIAGVVIMDYVFDNSPNSFTIKYRWELSGEANAATAVIKGDVDLAAEVEGPLWKFPTGECTLQITIPKVPFELSFNKTGDEKGNMKLIFKQPITEDWQSNCTFTDAPGAAFDTRGPPEKWLTKALEKARPPLRSIVIDLTNEETTTPLVISKQIIGDPPLGSMEIEGTASITITPGGE